MRKLVKPFSIIVFVAYIFTSCGTTGHIRFYDYSVSKDSLEKSLDTFLADNPSYICPINDTMCKKYTICDSLPEWKENGKGKLYVVYTNERIKNKYIFFHAKPEEIYWLSYYGDEQYWKDNPTSSRLALVGVVEIGGKWKFSDSILNRIFSGRKRVENRLENEVLSKLLITYTKVDVGD